MPLDIRYVDPRELRVPGSRSVADPAKLARQVARYGASVEGMPPIFCYEGSDGVLMIFNGVTRATRIAQLSPGTLVPVEVGGRLKKAFGPEPKIGDLIHDDS